MGHDAGYDAYMTGAVALQMSVAAITVHQGQARAEVPSLTHRNGRDRGREATIKIEQQW